MRKFSRREWLALSAAGALHAQGVSSRQLKPAPRAKPSGLPFNAWFTDVAAEAGLTAPTIYGTPYEKAGASDYIIEVVGCGVAFLDFDNDGWLDILC